MVRQQRFLLAVLAGAGLAGACQTIAGIEDKKLDPGPSVAGQAGATADADVEGGDAGPLPEAGDALPEVQHALPPARPPGDAGPSETGATLTLGAEKFYFGSVSPRWEEAFEPVEPTAWRRLGFDYDGKCTSLDQSINNSTNVCKRPVEGADDAQEDGDECRDNTAGHMFSLAFSKLPGISEKEFHSKTSIGEVATLIVQLMDVDEGPDDPYVAARVYISAPNGSSPTWATRPALDIDEGSTYGDLNQPKFEFAEGYMVNHVWVSGDFPGEAQTIPVLLYDKIVEVNADAVTLMIQLDSTHTSALESVFSAVFSVAEAQATLGPIINQAVGCDPFVYSLAMGFFVGYADLATGGTNFVNVAQSCDLLSFAAGVLWHPIQEPDTLVTVTHPPSPCDGGTDGG